VAPPRGGGLSYACGDNSGGQVDGRPKVVASFCPLFEAAQQIGGDRVQVSNLTPAGGEPHDLELNSQQVDRPRARE
jgi:zinc transport system substrate-binding protein